jgi:hypothetical protein
MNFDQVIEYLKFKKGVEFGGPTELFSNSIYKMPLYSHTLLDGANIFEENYFQNGFSDEFPYGVIPGKQFDVDCTDLSSIKRMDNPYDFVVTSHLIEHVANPIRTILNWKDFVLKTEGYILSIIPDYRNCFDRKRPLTTLDHLIDDFISNVDEGDETHVKEQMELHDWSMGGHKDFYELCKKNYKTRVVHHHTFTEESFKNMMEFCGFKNILSYKNDDLNIVNLSLKS